MSSRYILGGGLVRFEISLTYMLKRNGPSGLPCLTPLKIGTQLMLVPNILVYWFIQVSLIAFKICIGMPHIARFCSIISLLTLSNAFEKSTRSSQDSSLWLSLSSIADISCSYCRSDDLPFIAPNCVADMISLRLVIALRIVSSQSFTTVLMRDIGLQFAGSRVSPFLQMGMISEEFDSGGIVRASAQLMNISYIRAGDSC